MTIEDMHADFKRKLNKLDSQQYRNLNIPEIDRILNEAQELFVKKITKPRGKSYMGFEINQRSTDDIKTLVVEGESLVVSGNLQVTSRTFPLPDNYWYFVNATAIATKGECTKHIRVHIRQHDDKFMDSPFDKSSFDWEEVNAVFNQDGILVFFDEDFDVRELKLTYIKRLSYIHNGKGYNETTGYKNADGTYVDGMVDNDITPTTAFTRNSELPSHTHNEIVDIAVYSSY